MDELVPTPAAGTGLSETERVLDAFIAPTKTFEDIRRKATWWLPFLLMIVFSLATSWTVQHQVGFERVQENQIKANPKQEEQLNQMTPEQRSQRLATGAKITGIITYSVPVMMLAGFAIYALILWAAFNFGLGATTTYAQVLAVSFYAALPYLLTNVLLILTLFFGGSPEAYDYKNPVGTNLAYFMPDAGPAIKALLGGLDLIKLWSLVLQVLGMAVIARKTIMQSAVIVVGWWAILMVISVGMAAAFS